MYILSTCCSYFSYFDEGPYSKTIELFFSVVSNLYLCNCLIRKWNQEFLSYPVVHGILNSLSTFRIWEYLLQYKTKCFSSSTSPHLHNLSVFGTGFLWYLPCYICKLWDNIRSLITYKSLCRNITIVHIRSS